MPVFFLKPENALKRAKEFLEVGKKDAALDALADVIKSKKHRQWQKVHEEIMENYLLLCVELRRGHLAKEGLYQYKLISQTVSIASLEDSIRFFLRLANDKAIKARENSQQTVEDGKVVLDVDDLDHIQTPESLLLSAVSAEDTQARTDRVLLTPWVKFLWEAYRSVLDLLRNNAKLERIYHEVAKEAFQFCVDYARRTEFRKLCDNLRQHLQHIQNYQNQSNSVNLNSPESMQMHVETRLQQLDTAISLDLWQEAFKAINDVHGLLNMSKKPPRPAMVANYLMKQATVYWMANNPLFHAAACHRLLVLSREQKKNLSDVELGKLASRVVAATLAVPLHGSEKSNFTAELNEIAREKQRRLAGLLQLTQPPSRSSLIRDVTRLNILDFVAPELKQLYNWLESDFHPLQLCSRVAGCLEILDQDDELKQYTSKIKDVATARLLQQVAQVYSSIEMKRLQKMAPFVSEFGLENAIVRAAKLVNLQVRIDHRSQSVSFGADVSLVEQSIEGPMLQAMPSETFRKQLACMATCLKKAVKMVAPEEEEAKVVAQRRSAAKAHENNRVKEHRNNLKRKQVIERRKEEIESVAQAKERQEKKREQEKQRKAQAAEQARLKKEAEEREIKRKKDELAEIGRRQVLEKIEQIKKTAIGGKALANLKPEDIENLDADSLVAKQMAELDKEKRELATRLRAIEKRVDHFERAKRLAEIPLLQQQYEKQLVEDEQFHEKQQEAKIAKAITDREEAEKVLSRMTRMGPDVQIYIDRLSGHRNVRYQDEMKDFSRRLEEERERWRVEQEERRRQEEEERQRREEEEQKRLEEEERRRREEEEERKLREEEERRRHEEEEERRRQEEEEEERRREERARESREERPRDMGRNGFGRDDRNGFARDDRRDFGRDERPRDFGRDGPRDRDAGNDWRGGGRDERPRDFGRDDRRDFGRDDRRDFGRDDRRRDFGRDERPRDFGRDERPRDFGRDDRRDDRRDFGREERPRDFGRDERPRDFGRDDRRDFGRRDNNQGGGDWRTVGRDGRDGRDAPRGEQDNNDWRRAGPGPKDDRKDMGRDAPRRDFNRDAPRKF